MKNNQAIKILFNKAKNRSFFLANTFKDYQNIHNLNEQELLKFLNCTETKYVNLCLCRKPDVRSNNFRNDIERISDSFDIDSYTLAKILREVDTFITFKGVNPTTVGTLMAAREKKIEE